MAVGHLRRMAALFDLVAEEYDQHVPFFTAYARQFVPWLEVRPGDRFLDIGIGRGAVAREAEEAGARVVGVDVSVAMLTKSRHPVALMDAQRLAVRTGCVDVAAGAFSIHLWRTHGQASPRRSGPCGRAAPSVLCSVAGPPHPSGGPTTKSSSGTPCIRRESHGMPPLVPFGDPYEVLAAAGLVEIDAGESEIHVPVANGETFLRGELAHGYRSLFDVIAVDRRREMEAEMLEHLRQMEASGGIVLDRVAVFAKGRKAGG